MTPEAGRAGFRIGCLLILTSAFLLVFLEPGSAEHSITLLTLLMGLIFTGAVALLAWWSQR
ncbi:MAG: hypothetical protein CYG59_26755 [Chloroflexi bacterium]|nr:MAG: hypothetical protein CYG59_26755 [Chloroflexota bacterium]